MNSFHPAPRGLAGYALVTALIFLVLLTLVALAAIKGSGMEAKMSSNNTMRTQAFESSELSRTLFDTLIDANTFNRGWPQSIGGDVANNQFDTRFLALLATTSSCTDGFCISKESSTSTAPLNWFAGNTEDNCASPPCKFKPNHLDTDAKYQLSVTQAGTASIPVVADLGVYKVYTALATGAGAAMSSGYLGLGRGAAAGGGNIFFYANSKGHDSADSTTGATAQTASVFREVIRN